MTSSDERAEELNEASESVTITDRRRIDPETGAVRSPAAASTEAGPHTAADAPRTSGSVAPGSVPSAADVAAEDTDGASGDPEVSELAAAVVAELTEDLQRLAAEYKNYRDRTQREIAEARQRGRSEVVAALLETLDDVDRARAHGELDGPVKAIADNLTAALDRLGVERFAEVGEVFDPAIHEAMTHAAGEGLEQAICSEIYQPGYRVGDRIIRPARVGVTE